METTMNTFNRRFGYLLVACVLSTGIIQQLFAQITDEDGDWTKKYETLQNTPEAALMVRTGDIDNLGFGWPTNFNPFSGNSTPSHGYPWTADTTDPAGTDRIMVITSYNGNPPNGQDGYTSYTSRPENSVRPIRLTYSTGGLTVTRAILQIFVDDFQASVWKASYQVTINNVRVNFLETIINGLVQTGPVGKLISVEIPQDYLYLIEKDSLDVIFDDYTTGAGDGYAIDFIKLLVNPSSIAQVGAINGTVFNQSNNQPLAGVLVEANGIVRDSTDINGFYSLDSVLTGIVNIQTFKEGYGSKIMATELIAGGLNTVNFYLQSPAPAVTSVMPADNAYSVSIDTWITVRFDQKMDTLTFNSANFILSSADSSLAGNFLRSDTSLVFIPVSALRDDSDYRIDLTSSVKSLTGINLSRNYTWHFSTGQLSFLPSPSGAVPEKQILQQNYPNPFNPSTTIAFSLPHPEFATLKVYNILGSEVASLVSGKFQAGTYRFQFDGSKLASGIYYYLLTAGNLREGKKMILLK